MNTRTNTVLLSVSLLALTTLPGFAANTLVLQYDAGAGPAPAPGTVDGDLVTGGNQFWATGTGNAVNDGGTHAWQIADTSSGTPQNWNVAVPTASVTEAATDGWKFSWDVKAVLGGSGGYGANQWISAILLDNDLSDIWRFNLGVEADGDQIIQVAVRTDGGVTQNFSYTSQGEGEIYHLYELVFNPNTSTAGLFVDGIGRIGNIAGPSLTNDGLGIEVRWGEGTTGSFPDHIGNNTLVQFETVPEPSRLLLAAIGILGVALRRRRTC